MIVLWFYGIGCFIWVCGDLFGVYESLVFCIVKRVLFVLVLCYKNYVVFLLGNRVIEI